MGKKELKYGDNYPEQCPPKNAKEIDGIFYRFCSNPICEKDFKTHVDIGLSFPPKKLCEAKALSFFDTIEESNRYREKFPKRFNSKQLVKVHIDKDSGIGVLKKHHLNLWEYKNSNIFLNASKNNKEMTS